jgi:hypothetical protein
MKDLVVSVADSYQEKVMEALLPRIPISSGTRAFSYELIRNLGNDPGSYNDSHDLLRSYSKDYHYALVVFDYEGSGIEGEKTREEGERDVEKLLAINGWNQRNAVIIIEPELENWMWIDNRHVHDAIGWERPESLYNWARDKSLMSISDSKPTRPKETLEEALRISGTSKSSAIYKKIAANVSYKRCTDPAFLKLLAKLQEWFPIDRLL